MRRLVLLAVLALAAEARAEIAVLKNGQTLKVIGHTVDQDTVFLSLPGGGEVGTAAALVLGFVPDEVVEEVAPARNRSELQALAVDVARRHGLDPRLVLAVASVESGFRSDAVSPKGAQA